MRVTLPSGGSHKLTIPMTVLKDVWRKTEDEIKYRRFPICFIQANHGILLEPPEDVLRSTGYSEEIKERVKSDWLEYQKKIVSAKFEELYEKLAEGKISEWEFEGFFSRLRGELRGMASSYRTAFSERELHFIAAEDLDGFLSVMSIEEEQEKEEKFYTLLEEVKEIKEEVEKIKGILKLLDHNFKEGKISKKRYEPLRERFLGKLTLAEERLSKLRAILCVESSETEEVTP